MLLAQGMSAKMAANGIQTLACNNLRHIMAILKCRTAKFIDNSPVI